MASDDIVEGWATVYPHLRYDDPVEAIVWLSRVFGLCERVRMARPDGTIITSKLEGPDGGLVMVAGRSEEFRQWIRARVLGIRDGNDPSWPHLSHVTTVILSDGTATINGPRPRAPAF